MSCPFARILHLHHGFPFTFSRKCDILGNVIYGGVAKR